MERTPVKQATSLMTSVMSSLRLSALLCALLLSPCHGSPRKPEITKPPADTYIHEGEDATFRCDVTGDPLPQVTWVRDGKSSYSERMQVRGGHTLVITAASGADSGQYTCVATNMMGRVTASASLYVGTAPSFLVKPEDKTVQAGTRATLKCRVTGFPAPLMFWEEVASEQLFQPTSAKSRRYANKDGDLIIDPVSVKDAGQYKCTAANQNGFVSEEVTLSVV